MNDGSVCAIVGAYIGGMRIIRWINNREDEPQPQTETSTVFKFDRKGNLTVYEDGGFYSEVTEPFIAGGSGTTCALGALYMGATAIQAVEVAAKIDTLTDGNIQSRRLVKGIWR